MTLATLAEVLQPALKHGYAVGGLVTLGWEDMRAYVAAAEAENCAVLRANYLAGSSRQQGCWLYARAVRQGCHTDHFVRRAHWTG